MSSGPGRGGDQQCPMCGGAMQFCWSYDAPPDGEMRYGFLKTMEYYREHHRCSTCGHFLEWVPFDFDRLYAADYVDSTYGGLDGIRAAFARIMALPPEKSDNVQRVAWITDALQRHGGTVPSNTAAPGLLDVGFGLGVFPAAMKTRGWECHGIDLDPRQVEHANYDLRINAHMVELQALEEAGPFDLITFNKVLEHVERPESLLAAARRLLTPGGFVYLELPDGEAAAAEEPGREEFFLEHIHVFSLASFALLSLKAGFELIECVRVREPSSKFTLRGLLRAPAK